MTPGFPELIHGFLPEGLPIPVGNNDDQSCAGPKPSVLTTQLLSLQPSPQLSWTPHIRSIKWSAIASRNVTLHWHLWGEMFDNTFTFDPSRVKTELIDVCACAS